MGVQLIFTHKLAVVEVKIASTRKVCLDCGDRFIATRNGWIELDGRRDCPGKREEDDDDE